VIWTRPILSPATSWHLATRDPHGWQTLCRGRWAGYDPTETTDSPDRSDCCSYCLVSAPPDRSRRPPQNTSLGRSGGADFVDGGVE
jgi:hypothetical protein